MGDRCKVMDLNLAKLEQSADDPALNALLGQGWTVLASVAMAEGDGPPRIRLVLQPPAAAGADGVRPWVLGLAVSVGAATGTLVGLFGAALLGTLVGLFGAALLA